VQVTPLVGLSRSLRSFAALVAYYGKGGSHFVLVSARQDGITFPLIFTSAVVIASWDAEEVSVLPLSISAPLTSFF